MGHFLEYVKTCPRWILKNNSFLVNTLDKWPWPVTRKRLHDGVMKKTRGNRKRMSEQWPLTLRTALCPLENGQLSMFNISLANKQCIKLSSNFTEWSRNFMKGEHLALFGDLHLYYLKIGKLPQTSIQIPTWGRRDDPRNQSVITHVLLSDFLRDSLFLVFFFLVLKTDLSLEWTVRIWTALPAVYRKSLIILRKKIANLQCGTLNSWIFHR